MNSYQRETKEYLLDFLNKQGTRFDVHSFESGCTMIDIWHNKGFYVVQLEECLIGLSHITKENPGFDTIPDSRFSSFEEFKKIFDEIFH